LKEYLTQIIEENKYEREASLKNEGED